MKHDIQRLSNGLIVCYSKIDAFETAAIKLIVGVGSRHENQLNNGISHFVEHMVFKGTNTRSAKNIINQLENLGAHYNAYTSREHTAFYAQSLGENIESVAKIMCDMIRNSQFPENEMSKEKEVVLQEINESQDTPDELLFENFYNRAYQNDPLGFSVIGNTSNVKSFSQKNLFDHINQYYVPSNIIISIAGNFDKQRMSALIAKELCLNTAEHKMSKDIKKVNYTGGYYAGRKKIEQVHFAIGAPCAGYRNKTEYYIQELSSMVLGGNSSSRLFYNIRERLGLAYDISSFTSSYSDTGLFGVYGNTSPYNIRAMVDQICSQISLLTKDGPKKDEIERIKSQIKMNLACSAEGGSLAVASKTSGNIASYDRYIESKEVMERINSISHEDITHFMRNLFTKKAKPTIAYLGNVDNIYTYDDILDKFL